MLARGPLPVVDRFRPGLHAPTEDACWLCGGTSGSACASAIRLAWMSSASRRVATSRTCSWRRVPRRSILVGGDFVTALLGSGL